MNALSVVAVLLSPLIAVLVSMYLQHHKERRDAKRWIVTTLFSTRHSTINDETVRALNLIDIVFHDSPSVRRLWREYFEMLCNEGLGNPQGYAQRQKKNLELITEMAKALGYGRYITHLDVDRVYCPVGLEGQVRRSQDISDELLRVLKGTQGIQVTGRAEQVPTEAIPGPPALMVEAPKAPALRGVAE